MPRPRRLLLSLLLPLLAGCAASSQLQLRPHDEAAVLIVGSTHRVTATLVNRGRQPIRLGKGELRASLSCRTASSGDEWGVGTDSGMSGSVWGGVTDSRPPADDPQWCRNYPPATQTLAAGEALELEVEVAVPAECVPGEGELDLSYAAGDDGRHCPGIWFGVTGESTRRVSLRAAAAPASG
jgi:hypothetical protein